jgi:hypothetical protein
MSELTLETLRAELAPLGGEIANLVDSVAIIARALDFHRLPTEQPATDTMRRDRQTDDKPSSLQHTPGGHGGTAPPLGGALMTAIAAALRHERP